MHCPHPRLRDQVRTANTIRAGISTLAPPRTGVPVSKPPSYPTKHRHGPMQSYSKGSWGLSVLPRGDCIITNTSTSLSLWRRQCGHHYAIRAGRNLPDKEFRYLRTVIVTAAVYWDFNQELAPHHLIFQHRAGVRPYTSTFVLAESCVLVNSCSHRFSATLSPFGCTPTSYQGTPSPEVTVSICRVPSPEFSQAPLEFSSRHQCRFAVRSIVD